jgi:hypothetical protein
MWIHLTWNWQVTRKRDVGRTSTSSGIDRLLPTADFQSLAIYVLLREWQRKWDASDTAYCRGFSLTLVWELKGGQEICFHCIEGDIWSLRRLVKLE